jgi:hypothetical protein
MCFQRRLSCALSAILRAGDRGRAKLWHAGVLVVLSGVFGGTLNAQTEDGVALPRNTVSVTFVPAPTLTFPNQTDSNSPAVWDGQTF